MYTSQPRISLLSDMCKESRYFFLDPIYDYADARSLLEKMNKTEYSKLVSQLGTVTKGFFLIVQQSGQSKLSSPS